MKICRKRQHKKEFTGYEKNFKKNKKLILVILYVGGWTEEYIINRSRILFKCDAMLSTDGDEIKIR
jgi:hypothetical protein